MGPEGTPPPPPHQRLPQLHARRVKECGSRREVPTPKPNALRPPIRGLRSHLFRADGAMLTHQQSCRIHRCGDRKSTRLNSSHTVISYAVFCLKKKIIVEKYRART